MGYIFWKSSRFDESIPSSQNGMIRKSDVIIAYIESLCGGLVDEDDILLRIKQKYSFLHEVRGELQRIAHEPSRNEMQREEEKQEGSSSVEEYREVVGKAEHHVQDVQDHYSGYG